MLELGIIGALFFFYALVSRALVGANISAPMVFVTVGILCGPSVLGLLEFNVEGKAGLLIAEVALVIVLFSDAARSKVGDVRQEGSLPTRLLGIGMPLTIAAGTALAAVLLAGLNFWEGAVLAAVLAPTDAALGHAVVSSKVVPERIRQAINVEAGLNDGLSIPFLFLFLGLAVEQVETGATGWLTFAVEQIGIGTALGLAIGVAGGWLVQRAIHSGAMTHTFKRLSMVGIAVAAWAFAGELGGNGFIAAFVAGLAVARFRQDFGSPITDFAEREGQLLSLIVFFVFGTVAIGLLGSLTAGAAVFVLGSLSVLRMAPVAIALAGSGLRRSTIAFIGWFGPRGLASIILALVVVDEQPELPGLDLLLAVITLTVLASIFLHGFSARPLSMLYSKSLREMDEHAPEMMETEVTPGRSTYGPLSQAAEPRRPGRAKS